MRRTISLNDAWTFNRPGQPSAQVTLPHTWNAVDGQDGGNDYWRGTAVYERQFPIPLLKDGERVFLEFKGAAMTADVSVNDIPVAHHEGGYATFRADITDALKQVNRLIVAVDNGANDRVYPQRADFTFYGGLYRDVNLIIVPAVHFELVKDGTPGIRVTPRVDLKAGCADVVIESWQNGGEVTFTVNGEEKTVPSKDGSARAEFQISHVRLWDGLRDPYLYYATATLSSGDEISTHFGCREFRIDPATGFFLNGRSYPLRGVCRHQDRKGAGNALSRQQHREDMAILRELGANTVRLAHYQQSDEFYDLCDENGVIVWAEIPYITQHLTGGDRNTRSQMSELITQCCNHPSIVCWGLSNEITAGGGEVEIMVKNNRALNDLCHHLDPTRPTAMAHLAMQEMDHSIQSIADINSYNLYFGWYLGTVEENGRYLDARHNAFSSRIIGVSEYGADANPRIHSAQPQRGDYSEEYQCLFHEKLLECIEQRPYLWATHVWNLFDFAADQRNEGGKPGENQKGLVTFDRKVKKDAFYLYKAAWCKDPFIHICGRRYADRETQECQIKVYSNCDDLILSIDGIPVERKKGKRVFTFSVTLTGSHRIRAESGKVWDEITLRYVVRPNQNYRLSRAEVANWLE